LLEPYSGLLNDLFLFFLIEGLLIFFSICLDNPETSGLLLMPPEELAPATEQWVNAVHIHSLYFNCLYF